MKKFLFVVIVLSLLFRDFLLYEAATLHGSILGILWGLTQQNLLMISTILFYVILISLFFYLRARD